MKFTQGRCTDYRPPAGKADHVVFDEAMPGFGMRFRNGGAGTYFIQYRIGGKDGRLSLGKVSKVKLTDAQTEAAKQFAVVAQKIDPAVERAKAVSATADTIEPLIDDFVAYLERNGRVASYVAASKRSLKVLFKTLHRFSAVNITRTMVAKELSRLRTEHGPVAADVSRAHLSRFFTWAIAEGMAEHNPVSGTNKTGNTSRDRVLTDAELITIWNKLEDDHYGAISKLLILTGCRRDEIASLQRGEINVKDKQIELPGRRTKNGRDHIVPLSPLALSILQSVKPREGSDYIFGRGEGGFSGWSASKERLDERAKVLNWTHHDYRRTLSTVMHERLKVPPHIVEAVINHVSGSKAGVAGTYNRAEYLDEKRDALNRYSEFIDRLLRAKEDAPDKPARRKRHLSVVQ